MTNITTTNLSWSGSWTQIPAGSDQDGGVGNYNKRYYTEDSSETTMKADGDSIDLSNEAQQALDYAGNNDDDGLNTIAKIFDAAAAVINSSSSSDEEKIAAYGAAHTLEQESDFSLDETDLLNPNSYSSRLIGLEQNFVDSIANSTIANEAEQAATSSLPPDASDLQTALYEINKNNVIANLASVDGTSSLSINITETTTQTTAGSETNYAFSYDLTASPRAGEWVSSSLVDPQSAFDGERPDAIYAAKETSMGWTPTSTGSTASAVTESASTTDLITPPSGENPQETLDKEIVTELFGSNSNAYSPSSPARTDGASGHNEAKPPPLS
ncbi:hypothetical protein AAC691_17720 [Nguyenibacter vanlangensis]|uniref:Uncharacterized protein n=1 Tax=Nguyenibacter vanlangensis TaxID=1216886 RepID=A0ABZ3D3L9_9PROT